MEVIAAEYQAWAKETLQFIETILKTPPENFDANLDRFYKLGALKAKLEAVNKLANLRNEYKKNKEQELQNLKDSLNE